MWLEGRYVHPSCESSSLCPPTPASVPSYIIHLYRAVGCLGSVLLPFIVSRLVMLHKEEDPLPYINPGIIAIILPPVPSPGDTLEDDGGWQGSTSSPLPWYRGVPVILPSKPELSLLPLIYMSYGPSCHPD